MVATRICAERSWVASRRSQTSRNLHRTRTNVIVALSCERISYTPFGDLGLKVMNPWVDDAAGDGFQPNRLKKVQPDVLRHSFRVSEIVCHNGGLLVCVTRT